MTIYPILLNVTTTTPAPSPTQPAPFVASPGGGAGTQFNAATAQTFHAVVTGIGNVSATINVVVSNDGVNWLDSNHITIASAAAPQQSYLLGTNPWAYFSAYVSAISGTKAAVSLTMSA